MVIMNNIFQQGLSSWVFRLPIISRFYEKACPLSLLAIYLVMLVAPPQAVASTINWGSRFGDELYTSSGAALDGSFSFEIGSFGSFIPTTANIALWAANWKVFDRVFDPTPADPDDGDPEGWNVPSQFFVGSTEHNVLSGSDSLDADPLNVFSEGEIGYLWVYNSKDLLPSSQWALIGNFSSAGDTGNLWQFPDPATPPGTAYEWLLADADTTVFGGVNNVQGPGSYAAIPGSFSLQTAVVPEPGSAVLLLIGATAGFMFRRHRGVGTRALQAHEQLLSEA